MERLFHISEKPDIKVFHPRPSPQFYESITGNVVFAVSDKLLHNYLLPRDCPRVTYYLSQDTSEQDKNKFFGNSTSNFIINIESDWMERIEQAKLYKYEFYSENFILLDEIAGYYISYKKEIPTNSTLVLNTAGEFKKRNVELRYYPAIKNLANEVKNSTLNYSLIRMKNSK